MRKVQLYVLVILTGVPFFSDGLHAHKPVHQVGRNGSIEDFRFGAGVGYGLYVTNQMDYKITRNYGEFNELIPNYTFGIYKTVGEQTETGLHYRNGHLLTLKSQDTQGSTCDFNEAQLSMEYSLNQNILLENSPVTVNARIGLGATYFRSKYFTVDTDTKAIDEVYSTVGYEGALTSSKDQPEKQFALIGNLGLNLGLRISRGVSLYWENTLNVRRLQ